MGDRAEQKRLDAEHDERRNVRAILDYCRNHGRLKRVARKLAVMSIDHERLAKMWRKYQVDNPVKAGVRATKTGTDFVEHVRRRLADDEVNRRLSVDPEGQGHI